MQLRQASTELDAESVPDDVRSPKAKLVYLYLAVAGESSVDDVCDDLHLTHLDVYGVLDSLRDVDAVTERDGVFATAF